MSTITRAAVAAVAVLALAGCTSEPTDDPVGQFSAPQHSDTATATSPSSTPGPQDAATEAPGPSTGPTPSPTPAATADGEQVAHDLEAEEHDEDATHSHDADNTFDFSDVDRTDPEQVVATLACYFYATDGSDEQPETIAGRVASFATPELATEMADMRISGDPGQVRLVQPVATEDTGDGWYDQRCKVETRDAETYAPVAVPVVVNLRVHVTTGADGQVLADKFVVTY